MRFYGRIEKIDAEQRLVYGYASTEAVDAHGEIIRKDAIEAALDDYMEFANIREMHQLSAVGTAEEASVDDKGLYLGAKVVDDVAWGKVTSGVYKGFSIGGKTLARDPDDKKIITKILLTEISLVDRPSNPEARFDVWKAAGSPQEDASMATKTKTAEAELPLTSVENEALTKLAPWLADGAEIAEGDSEAVEHFAKRDFSAKERKKDAKSGAAMPDGSFPIENETDLKNAIRLAGHAKDPAAARAHIKRRAKALGLSDRIPDTWKAAEAEEITGAEDTGEAIAKVETEPAAAEGEDIAKADGDASDAGEAAKDAPALDPIAKATSALDKIDAAVASVAKPDDVQKGLYEVGRFAEVLQTVVYLCNSAEYEAEMEADGSPVPAQLRDWIKAGAKIFTAMAKEEVDELVAAGAKVKKAAPAGEITPDLAVTGGEALAKAVTDITAERDALAKTIAEKDDALAKLADRIEPLAQTVADLVTSNAELVASNAELAKRFSEEPAPAKTAGPMATAVSKEEDAGGGQSIEKTAPSPDDLAKALSEMSEEDRALLLIKASRQLPRPVTYR